MAAKTWRTIQLAKRQQRQKELWYHLMTQERKPYFEFNNLPPTERLSFELMNGENYLDVFELFKNDENPFVMKDYKDLDKWEKYVDLQLYLNRFSSKHGTCDWLIKRTSTQQTIGILNIHELSRDTFQNYHQQCMIGYSIAASFRRKGYALEAVKSFISYIFNNFELNKLIANTEKGNIASKSLLYKLGFVTCKEHYFFGKQYDYFELKK